LSVGAELHRAAVARVSRGFSKEGCEGIGVGNLDSEFRNLVIP
jgi:hypothetical protein